MITSGVRSVEVVAGAGSKCKDDDALGKSLSGASWGLSTIIVTVGCGINAVARSVI